MLNIESRLSHFCSLCCAEQGLDDFVEGIAKQPIAKLAKQAKRQVKKATATTAATAAALREAVKGQHTPFSMQRLHAFAEVLTC